MIITDLNYLEKLTKSDRIVGGMTTITTTEVFLGSFTEASSSCSSCSSGFAKSTSRNSGYFVQRNS